MKDLQEIKYHNSPWGWVPSLYFAKGLPVVTIMILSLVFYKQLGLSNAEITFYTSWFYLPWVIKPLWKPYIDRVRTRRWWAIIMELVIGVSFCGVAFTIPTSNWLRGSLCFFWLMAFACATHDMAAHDLFQISVAKNQKIRFYNYRNFFYRLATVFGQGVLVMIVGNLEVIYRNSIRFSWSLTFYFLTGVAIVLWFWHIYILPKDEVDKGTEFHVVRAVKAGIRGFLKKYDRREVVVGILFLVFYVLPDGLMTKVASLFLIDSSRYGGLGLSPQEYALVAGTVGVIGMLAGVILGYKAINRDGLRKWLFPMVCAITLPDVVYILLSYMLVENNFVIGLCLFVEQFGFGFGLTAYYVFVGEFARGKSDDYSMCTALSAVGLLFSGLVSGALQETMGYHGFFFLVLLTSVVAFVVTALVYKYSSVVKNK